MSIYIFKLQLSFIILIGYVVIPSQLQSISDSWQSSTNLSSSGFEFSPVNQQALLLFGVTTNSLMTCSRTCHSTVQCRIFDYDGQSQQCRIFEGNITIMGSIVASSSSQSRVGSIKFSPQQFVNLGQSCSYCQGSRYLTCVNNTCQCPSHTYFDGTICQSQKLIGAYCNNSTECRSDLNYTCLARMQCGLASMQTATIVAGSANGTAGSTLSTLQHPTGLSVGIDNSFYISDNGNARVIKLQVGSLIGSIVAGTGIAGGSLNQLNGPTGVFVDSSLNIYVADNNNHRIMFWRKNSSAGVQVAGSGSSGSSLNSFAVIAGLFVDSQGNIYVCDSSNHRIMKFAPNITNAVLVIGTGTPGSGNNQLNSPFGMDFDEFNSYLYVADYNNNRIQRFQVNVSTNGTTVAGGHGAGAGSNQLNLPYAICVSKITNALYIADSGNSRVQRWSSGAASGVTMVGNGASTGNLSTPVQGSMDIKLSINETYLLVSETNYNRVWSFTLV